MTRVTSSDLLPLFFPPSLFTNSLPLSYLPPLFLIPSFSSPPSLFSPQLEEKCQALEAQIQESQVDELRKIGQSVMQPIIVSIPLYTLPLVAKPVSLFNAHIQKILLAVSGRTSRLSQFLYLMHTFKNFTGRNCKVHLAAESK